MALPRAFLGPRNTTEVSAGFQQSFRMYAKLIMGLKDSKVKISKWTPLTSQGIVMRVSKPSLDELEWDIWVI